MAGGIKAPKVGNKHKGLRSAKNKASGYYTKQRVQTEINRRRKRLKHFRAHPNNIKGVEELRKALGI